MNASRKIVLVGLIVGGLLLLATLATIFTRPKSGQGACDDFLAKIIKQDYKGSYGMLTDSAKQTDPIESWKAKVTSLTNAYKGGTAALVSTQNSSSAFGDTAQNRTEYYYTVSNPSADSKVTCYIPVKNEQKIDGFNSEVVRTKW